MSTEVPDTLGPAVRRRQLARQLRDLRLAAGLATVKQAADASGLSTATISRVESAKQTILPRTVRLLCTAYGIGSPMLDHLLRLAADAEERGWVVEYSATVPDWFGRYIGEESDAREIWAYEAEFVPGLLQTADYCRAVSAASSPTVTTDELDRLVALRQRRQERLGGKNPPTLTAVVNEGTVRRLVGGHRVMRGQLDHLIEQAQRPNITIHVLPFAAGAHPAMTGSFSVMHFPAGAGDPTVFVEVDGGALYPDRRIDFDRYAWVFGRLRELALTPEATIALLSTLAKQNPGE